MSYHDYLMSRQIAANSNYSFHSLIMAAMRRADDDNFEKLKKLWPDHWKELQVRFNAPGGIIPEDAQPDKVTVSHMKPETSYKSSDTKKQSTRRKEAKKSGDKKGSYK